MRTKEKSNMNKTFENNQLEKKRKRRQTLSKDRKNYEVAKGFSWNGRCLTISPTKSFKSEDRVNKMVQNHLLSRSNLTLVTGQPDNGKLEYTKGMLNRRKYESIRQHLKEIEKKEKYEAYRDWLRQFGKQPNEVEDRYYDLFVTKYFDKVLDNDRNKMEMVDLIEKEDSSFGYKCKLLVFSFTKKTRQKDFEDFIEEVEASIAPRIIEEDYEKEIYDEEKDETRREIVKRKFPQLPPDLLIVADFTTEERKEFLKQINQFRYRNFIKSFDTCLVYDVKPKTKNTSDYSHPTAIEGWNQVDYLDKNGKVKHIDRYHNNLLYIND